MTHLRYTAECSDCITNCINSMHWNCHIKLQKSPSNDIKFTFFCRRGCVEFVSQEGSEEKEEVGLVRDALGNARTALSFILLITPAWVASTKILHCWHSFPPVPGLNAIGFNYLSKGGKFYRLRAIPWGILHLFVTFSFTLDRCLRLYLTKWTNHSLLEPGQWGEPFEAVKIISGGGGSGGWVRSDARLLVVPVMGGHKSASCNGQHLGGRQCTKIFLSYHSHLKIIIQTVHARKIFALCNQQDLQNIPYHASSNCRDGGVARCMCFFCTFPCSDQQGFQVKPRYHKHTKNTCFSFNLSRKFKCGTKFEN